MKSKYECEKYGPTTIRIAVGLLMLVPGLAKIANSTGIIGMLGKLGFPASSFFGWAIILAEIIAFLFLTIKLFSVVIFGFEIQCHLRSIDPSFSSLTSSWTNTNPGKKWITFLFALLTFIIDLSKGIIPAYLLQQHENLMLICGFSAMLGHVYPIFYKVQKFLEKQY